jgi:hypothetical protein
MSAKQMTIRNASSGWREPADPARRWSGTMEWSEIARYEWMILLCLPLALLLWELRNIRREIRRHREAEGRPPEA